jgi:shikimate kinase
VNIALLGFMGTGKTSIGKALAKKLNRPFIDIDEQISRKMKMPIKDIFSKYGEAKFRSLEFEEIADISSKDSDLIISCGGGAVLDLRNIDNLRRHGICLCLTSSAEIIFKRVRGNSSRPVLGENITIKHIKEILSARQEFYKHCDYFIDTSSQRPAALARKIISLLKREEQ